MNHRAYTTISLQKLIKNLLNEEAAKSKVKNKIDISKYETNICNFITDVPHYHKQHFPFTTTCKTINPSKFPICKFYKVILQYRIVKIVRRSLVNIKKCC